MSDQLQLTDLQRVLFMAGDAAKVAEDFLRNLLVASGGDVRARAGRRRSNRWRGWTDRERISTVVVGGDQLRRARLALVDYCAELEALSIVRPAPPAFVVWAELTESLQANAIGVDELSDERLDVAHIVRAALVGDALRRVLAVGAAIEKARIRLVLQASRSARPLG